ncbi:DUF4123 domain-containing protein [Rodentibacter caecimuris]|uniref:DUF4123 domain-containing protein n=1 Tax=Rodentibacter caecimuris TaxID=1796644 RepID=UPI000986DC2F|nr:hypothetical protein BKG97_08905 [Rodentibacter heylii]
MSTQQPTGQIWLTHYHLSHQATPHITQTAYLLCLAEDTENYFQQVEHYLNQHQLIGQAQLAPLPIQTWLSRHGFEAALWRAAQQVSNNSPLFCLYTDETGQTKQHLDTFLNRQSVRFSPFTEFIAPAVLPDEVRSLFFADFEGLGECHQILNQAAHKKQREKAKEAELEKHSQNPPHFYAVVDCAKAVSFPYRLESAGRMANLYTGNIGQPLEEQAPYLLEFDPYQEETVAFLQRLFRKADSKVFSHWAINPVIFIKSRQSFDEVYRHLRKWTHLYDPNAEKWYFFRFYDPLVLNRYLPQLTHYPAQLAALFGVKSNTRQAQQAVQPQEQSPIIEAFGVRVEQEFICFSLNPLPENTQPAKIELGEIEEKIFQRLAWTKFSEKLIETVRTLHPNHSTQNYWSIWLDEAKDSNLLSTERSYFYYLNGRILAAQKQQNYWTKWEEIQSQKTLSELDLVKKLMESFNGA